MAKLGQLLRIFFVILFFPGLSYAASTPIDARAVFVEGEVSYIFIEDSASYAVEVDTPFREGDRVITGAAGKVEIEFGTGALLLLDNGTDVTIESLKRDEGAISAIFNLAVGMIKSSFNKLSDVDVIEYHTRAAVTGIAGTPEHIVKADRTDKGVDRTNVYLLGEEDDEGSLYVRGFDPDKTEVILLPAHGTTVLAGLAPVIPFLLASELLKSLGILNFHTGAGAAAGTTTGAAAGGGISAGTLAVVGGVAAVGAVAAGGGGGGGSNEPIDVTGRWTGDFTVTFGDGSIDPGSMVMELVQSGTSVTGTITSVDLDSGNTDTNNVSGRIDGATMTLTIGINATDRGDPDCRFWDLGLVATISGDTMTARFEGSGCGRGDEQSAIIVESRGTLTRN